ncbi:MFS transporter [Roseomonas sp. WA12]
MAEAAAPAAATRWLEIFALVAAGMAAALQLGKVAPSLLAVAADLGIGLGGAAGLLSVFALVAAATGLPAGLLAARAGVRRTALIGLCVLGGAGLAAAIAPDRATLYACRLVEGAAFLAVVVSAPALVAARAAPVDRAVAMACWSSFMPGGIALGMLAAPLVAALGWRAAWGLLALMPWGAAVLVTTLVPYCAGAPVPSKVRLMQPVPALWRARLPLVVAGAFSCYAIVYFGIAGFLPARLVEGFGVSLPTAGLIGAGAAIVNVCGNLLSGWLMRRGWRPAILVMAAGSAMTILSAGAFALPSSLVLTVATAMLASGLGGTVPGSLFALMPRAVPEPVLVAPALGLLVQFNSIGSVLAPLVIAAAAQRSWPLAALPLLAAGLGMVLLARGLRRIS